MAGRARVGSPGSRPGSRGLRAAAIVVVAVGTVSARPLLSGPGPGADDGRGGVRYLDGPPPGHTGGFGEPTCHRCHFDAPVGSGGGGLSLKGLPERYEPGRGYRLVVELTAPDLERGGFELAIRCGGAGRRGEQAGAVGPVDGRAEVVPGEGGEFAGDPAVQYARHTRAGAASDAGGTLRWTLRWSAPGEGEPAAGCGPVLVHAAANAANGDDSEFGDHVHTAEARVQPRR